MKVNLKNTTLTTVAIAILSIVHLPLHLGLAQTSGFTYQGRPGQDASPASGSYDLQFAVYDASSSGNSVAGPITKSLVAVSNGLFTVTLDFGADVFTGADRWLQIAARTNGAGSFVPLSPRQQLTATPYAVRARNAQTADTATTAGAVATGSIGTAALATGAVDSSRIADGTITAADVNSASFSNTFWKLDGNAAIAREAFLGTTGNQALELKVNNTRALRLEPAASPNVIGGHPDNFVSNGVAGATISGGGGGGTMRNVAAANYAAVGGGAKNSATGYYATVAGGAENVASGSLYATVGGGVLNQSSGESATIAGGYQNMAANLYAAVGGGWVNRAMADFSSIGGGRQNTTTNQYAAVGGGRENIAGGELGVIGGGWGNIVGPSAGGVIDGGSYNRVLGDNASIGGGQSNRIGFIKGAAQGVIGGGSLNRIDGGAASVIGGGSGNTTDEPCEYSVIGGGYANHISEWQILTTHFNSYATIAGGYRNSLYGQYATIGGGALNTAYGLSVAGGTVAGGMNNVAFQGAAVGGGTGNNASGGNATIPGGSSNAAPGYLSFAAGHRANAAHQGSFVWADSSEADYASTADDEFSVRANGGVRVQSAKGIHLNAADAPLIVRDWDIFAATATGGKAGIGRWGLFMENSALTAGVPAVSGRYFQVARYQTDGTFTQLMRVDQAGNVYTAGAVNPPSDRNAKTSFAAVQPRQILERVANLPIQSWVYKADESAARHIGPTAQDFHAAFKLGTDDKHIATVDADGVALAAIQGLNQKLEEKEAEIAGLKERLAALEKIVTTLNAKGN